LLQAAAFEASQDGTPTVVIPIDLSGWNPETGILADYLSLYPECQAQELKAQLEQTQVDLEVSVNVIDIIGLST
jgi:hypothetical protein